MEGVHNAPLQRPEGRSKRIGQAVARATLELVIEQGLAGLTFENVARRADVNRSTLYRRWENKSRLLTWVMLEFTADQAPMPDLGSLKADLTAAMLNLSSALTSPVGSAIFPAVLTEARTDQAVAQALHFFWQQRLELAQPIHSRAVARQELAADADLEFLTDLVFGPVAYHVLQTGSPIDPTFASRVINSALAKPAV